MTQPDPAAVIRAYTDAWVAQSIELRRVTLPPAGSAAPRYFDTLLEVRGRLDQLEEILSQAIALRATAHRRHSELAAAAEDAWDIAASRLRQSGRLGDYVSGRERAAECNLTILEQRRAERAQALLLSAATECVDRIRVKYRGLGDVRQELLATLRQLQFESHLER